MVSPLLHCCRSPVRNLRNSTQRASCTHSALVNAKMSRRLNTMAQPMFVRTLTEKEKQQLEAGLRATSAFTLRRCQILLASSQRQRVSTIARLYGCGPQTVRQALLDFHAQGSASIYEQSCHRMGVPNETRSSGEICAHAEI